MLIGVPSETLEYESRVAVTLNIVKKLTSENHKVCIEKDAGVQSGFSNNEYKKCKASIVDNVSEAIKKNDIIVKVQKPDSKLIHSMKGGSILIGLLSPRKGSSENTLYNKKKISAFALENIPRITRAQDKDVLSSQSNLAGYKAVLDAAHEYSKSFPIFMSSI